MEMPSSKEKESLMRDLPLRGIMVFFFFLPFLHPTIRLFFEESLPKKIHFPSVRYGFLALFVVALISYILRGALPKWREGRGSKTVIPLLVLIFISAVTVLNINSLTFILGEFKQPLVRYQYSFSEYAPQYRGAGTTYGIGLGPYYRKFKEHAEGRDITLPKNFEVIDVGLRIYFTKSLKGVVRVGKIQGEDYDPILNKAEFEKLTTNSTGDFISEPFYFGDRLTVYFVKTKDSGEEVSRYVAYRFEDNILWVTGNIAKLLNVPSEVPE